MEKIKQFFKSEQGKDILIVLIVIFVGISSFELGRLSKVQNDGIKVQMPANEAQYLPATPVEAISISKETNLAPQNTNQNANYFASSRGTKYYTLGCSAGKSLSQNNRVYFNTSAEAEKAGYSLSSSCK